MLFLFCIHSLWCQTVPLEVIHFLLRKGNYKGKLFDEYLAFVTSRTSRGRIFFFISGTADFSISSLNANINKAAAFVVEKATEREFSFRTQVEAKRGIFFQLTDVDEHPEK